ncbi:zinc ion binding protein [Rhynchospora pubera]|uniref:Zinc ion binding protein n=1 Tax=Rhynchospora pubera TaxID=906938 RepID=A0AAV8C3M5_9POAL|nr:zinc ion binding protein [Rhynchospora pubera]
MRSVSVVNCYVSPFLLSFSFFLPFGLLSTGGFSSLLMARWDAILSLPVQNPPTPELSAAHITWSKVEGWKDTIDRLALIPYSRVNDFVRGESNNKHCPTRFHIEARRKRSTHSACKPKVDGILEYILYWCSFGPDDHRKGGVVRPSRAYAVHRKTPAGRPNTKRGCTCHFIVKRLIAEPSVALIIYNKDKHVDKNGLPCHGSMDQKAAGTRAMFAPYISDEFKLQVMSLLHVGVPVETIMQRHTEAVERQGGPSNRDDLLTHRCVRRMERKIRRTTYELDMDDAVSVSMWVENNHDQVFFYEDYSRSDTFVLGIQTDWQLQQMICYGNRSLLASDSKFGSNKLKYPVYSVLVFDSDKNAIPVAWIITPKFANSEIHRWLGTLYHRVRTKDPTWQLGGFIIDDPLADLFTIKELLQCSVSISFWRLRRAWHKNLLMKCCDMETCAMMSKQLGEALHSICDGTGDVGLFEAFLERFVGCAEFSDYFKATWFPRLGVWIKALRSLPSATSEVTSAIESYHHLLKIRLLNEKDQFVYQRADWLVQKLSTKVHSYYWLDEYSEKEIFSRYWKDEWKRGLSAWREGSQIPAADIKIEPNCAKVVCQKNREMAHVVLNPGSEFALCDCTWSKAGYICKHAAGSTKVYRERGLVGPSMSMICYNRALMSMLDCVPSDCLVRDHAVGLAVRVREELVSLLCSKEKKDKEIGVRDSQQSSGKIENEFCISKDDDTEASEKRAEKNGVMERSGDGLNVEVQADVMDIDAQCNNEKSDHYCDATAVNSAEKTGDKSNDKKDIREDEIIEIHPSEPSQQMEVDISEKDMCVSEKSLQDVDIANGSVENSDKVE